MFATFVTLLLLAAIAGDQEARLSYWSSRQHAQDIESGAELFYEHCRSCHGVDGEGVGEMGPALNDESFFLERTKELGWEGTLGEYAIATITQGRVASTRPLYAGDGNVVMSAWSQEYSGPLRPDEIRSLAKYVLNWEASALGEFTPQELALPTPVAAASSEQIAHGANLFEEAGCAECHAVQGVSTSVVGPELSQIGQIAASRIPGYTAEDYIRESFLIPNAYVVEGYPEKSGCGGVLTQEDFNDLVAFLLSLK